MLAKKVYRQNSSRASSMKKYIEDRQTSEVEKEEETEETSNVQGNKWVKTDSECKLILNLLSITFIVCVQ